MRLPRVSTLACWGCLVPEMFRSLWNLSGFGRFPFAALTLSLCLLAFPAPRLAAQSAAKSHRKVVTMFEPEYPTILKNGHFEGQVRLEATVLPNGNVSKVDPKGGNHLRHVSVRKHRGLQANLAFKVAILQYRGIFRLKHRDDFAMALRSALCREARGREGQQTERQCQRGKGKPPEATQIPERAKHFWHKTTPTGES